jgi:SAM-dependent methyltransferase
LSQLRKLLLQAKFAVVSGGSQNFLGSSLVPLRLKLARDKRKAALRVLSFSPHYFCLDGDHLWPNWELLEQEENRNRNSREKLTEDVVLKFAKPADVVIDYGCGPGFLAASVARHVARLTAVDISDGVLACARVINPGPNLLYRNANDLGPQDEGTADMVYSFAVAQHLSDAVLTRVLSKMFAVLRKDGKLLLHVVMDAAGWSTEKEWTADQSLRGKMKMRYGLHCFNRSELQIRELVGRAGFKDIRIEPMSSYTAAEQDLGSQDLLTARRP